jgi:hypothetical protein
MRIALTFLARWPDGLLRLTRSLRRRQNGLPETVGAAQSGRTGR